MKNEELVRLYEDSDLLIINKPPGMVVNNADSVVGSTVQDWVEKNYAIKNLEFEEENEESRVFLSRSGIAHRLDKDTSGCLVVAKNPATLKELLHQFKERKVIKTYLALVRGRMEPKEGSIRLPLARDPKDRKRFRVRPGGKMAETDYAVDGYYVDTTKSTYTLVRLYPKTGRTHQLRVHLAHIKHPIVADVTYGTKHAAKDRAWCARHFLHALHITVLHPKTRITVRVEAPLSHDLELAMKQLERVGE